MNRIDLPELEAFTAYLRSQGFASGAGERVRAVRLFGAVPSSQRNERLKTRLAPVFARDAEEQRRFYHAFDLFFQPLAAAAAPIPLDRPMALPVHGRKTAWRPPSWLIALTVISLGVVVAVVVARSFITPLPTPTVEPPPGTLGRPIQRTIDSVRSCGGWECLTADWRPFALAAPFIAFGLWMAFRRSRVFADLNARRRERNQTEPFEWPLRVQPPPLAPAVQRATQSAAGELAKRLAADSEELDIPATIYETARQAGFPCPRFLTSLTAPEYLVLIEEQSPSDHLASWFDAVAQNLHRRGVRIDAYRYRHTPRVCFRSGSGVQTPFRRLLQQHASRRVLLVGEPSALADAYSGALAPWAGEIERHENRAWMTPAAPFEWGSGEANASRWIRIMPARLAAFSSVGKMFDAPAADTIVVDVGADEYPLPPPDLVGDESNPDVHELRTYLDPEVFRWLAACAIHSDLDFRLTCRLALEIDSTGGLLEEKKLLQLMRLPWFRRGRIPARWRLALIRTLDPASASRVRSALVKWLARNQAPRGSFAHSTQRAQIAAHQYYVNRDDPKRRAAATSALSRVARADIAADPLLNQLNADLSVQPSGSRQRIAASFYVWRNAYVVSTALVVAATCWLAAWLASVPVQHQTQITEYQYVPALSVPAVPESPAPVTDSKTESTPTPSPPPTSKGPSPASTPSGSRPTATKPTSPQPTPPLVVDPTPVELKLPETRPAITPPGVSPENPPVNPASGTKPDPSGLSSPPINRPDIVQPPPTPAIQIASVVSAFASALNARDLRQLGELFVGGRVAPSIVYYQRIIASCRSLNVSAALIGIPESTGSTLTATVDYRYGCNREYSPSVAERWTFVQVQGTWRIQERGLPIPSK